MSDAMTRDELVEAMAKAIYQADDANYAERDPGSATLGPWEKFPEHWKEDYRKQARAALSAAEAHGWVMVPRIPTEAMLIDGSDEVCKVCPNCSCPGDENGVYEGKCWPAAVAVWQAMLATAIEREGGNG